jgi:hypothetical protein
VGVKLRVGSDRTGKGSRGIGDRRGRAGERIDTMKTRRERE